MSTISTVTGPSRLGVAGSDATRTHAVAVGRIRGRRNRAAAARLRPVGPGVAGLRPPSAAPSRRPVGLQPPPSLPGRAGPTEAARRVIGADPNSPVVVAAPRPVSLSSPPASVELHRVLLARDRAAASGLADRPTVAITRRGRLLLTACVLGLTALLLAVAGGAMVGAAGSEQAPIVYTTVTLEPGQSLWEVARSVAPDTDPRATVARIVELNNLTSPGAVRAGQQIAVPSALLG